MRRITFAILTAGLLSAAPASAATDIFLCSPQIQGETLDTGFPGCSDVLEVSNAGFVEGNAAEPRDIRFMQYVDSTTVILHRLLATQDRLDEATFWFRRSGTGGGAAFAHMSLKLFDVSVTSMASSYSGGEDRATEATSFRAARIQYMYRKQVGSGSFGSPVYTCWNVQAGTASPNPC